MLTGEITMNKIKSLFTELNILVGKTDNPQIAESICSISSISL